LHGGADSDPGLHPLGVDHDIVVVGGAVVTLSAEGDGADTDARRIPGRRAGGGGLAREDRTLDLVLEVPAVRRHGAREDAALGARLEDAAAAGVIPGVVHGGGPAAAARLHPEVDGGA